MAWKPEVGVSIMTGKDEILGMGKGSYLSMDLITHLNEHHVYYLYQVRRALAARMICSNWLNSIDLGQVGDLPAEWERYKLQLIDAGISLSDTQDELRWMGGTVHALYQKTMFITHWQSSYSRTKSKV